MSRSTLSYALSEWEKNAMQPSMHKKQMESKLHTSITRYLLFMYESLITCTYDIYFKANKEYNRFPVCAGGAMRTGLIVCIMIMNYAGFARLNANNVILVDVVVSSVFVFVRDTQYKMSQSLKVLTRKMQDFTNIHEVI